MASTTEQRRDKPEFNLREWDVKARMLSRENTRSRRFSVPNVRSLTEDTRSFRSNITISSTVSSPGYTLKEEINPSTYSFTNALKALQARSTYTWEWLSGDGFALNSKWNEAEKYICNPLSGEVPMECLSAKTLSGLSSRSLADRITTSAPLSYPSHSRLPNSKLSLTTHENEVHPIQEEQAGGMTKDAGTQSTIPDQVSSSSPSPASTPPIEERSIKRVEAEVEDSPVSNIAKLKFEEKVEGKETGEKEETRSNEQEDQREEAKKQIGRCTRRQGGCLSWRILTRRQREKHPDKPRKKNIFIRHFNGC